MDDRVADVIPWTRERLATHAAETLGERKLIVVSNREPYLHARKEGEIECLQPAGGLANALDSVLRATGGVWIAHGAGSADRETSDAAGRLAVPPNEPSYTLRRIWLSKREEEGYYYGFANQALWPLCHVAYVRPTFHAQDWSTYEEVNRRFAEVILEEVGRDSALVLVQDYHLALVPALLRAARPDLGIAHFWHIPWPHPEVFRICPWRRAIYEGLLGNDLMGFHLQHDCQRFLECLAADLDVQVSHEEQVVRHGERAVYVRPFPIGADASWFAESSTSAEVERELARLKRRLPITAEKIVIGVDRLDYTKGVPDRLRAFDRFLVDNPAWRGRVQYVGVAAPSRTHLQTYQDLGDLVDDLVEDINWRHGDGGWQPVCLLREHANRAVTTALYRLGDVCMITSLHDGMNLVAKEYAATRVDGDGMLILSQFTGSARQLRDAVQVNPYDVAGMADALRIALEMDGRERRARMRRMRDEVLANNIYAWAAALLLESVRHAAAARAPRKQAMARERSGSRRRKALAASAGPGASAAAR